MAFFNKSLDDIKRDLFDKIRENAETKKITNFNPGGIFRGFIEIVAYFIYLVYQALENVFQNAFVKTATGEWLDLKCDEVGITRKQATKTKLYIIFGRNEIKNTNIKIKQGTLIKTSLNINGDEYFFQTLEDEVLPAGLKEIKVLCESLATGVQNNLTPNDDIYLLSPIVGIDYVKPDEIAQYGTDTETDEELRERYYLAWKSLNVGGKDYYASIALSVSGVKQAKVIPAVRGAGTLDIIISSVEGVPSQQLINEVQTKINENLQFDGIDVRVQAPFVVEISLDLYIKLYYLTTSESDFTNTIRMTLNKYFNEFQIGQDFVLSQMTAFLINKFNNIKDISSNIIYQQITDYQLVKVNINDISCIVEES